MTTEENDALRWQLQGLRREMQPESDLWPGIAARLAQAPQPGLEQPKRIGARRFVPLAMAASVLVIDPDTSRHSTMSLFLISGCSVVRWTGLAAAVAVAARNTAPNTTASARREWCRRNACWYSGRSVSRSP